MIETAPEARRPLWTLVGPGLGAMLAAYHLGVLIGPLREALQRDLGLGAAQLLLVVAGQVVALVAGLLPGFLFGRRLPATVAGPGIGLLLVGDLLTALTPNAFVLIVGALLIGFGGGAAAGVALGLAGAAGERRVAALAAVGAVALAGLLFGLVFGWFATTALSWRWAFFLAVPMALLALAVTGAGGLVALARRK